MYTPPYWKIGSVTLHHSQLVQLESSCFRAGANGVMLMQAFRDVRKSLQQTLSIYKRHAREGYGYRVPMNYTFRDCKVITFYSWEMAVRWWNLCMLRMVQRWIVTKKPWQTCEIVSKDYGMSWYHSWLSITIYLCILLWKELKMTWGTGLCVKFHFFVRWRFATNWLNRMTTLIVSNRIHSTHFLLKQHADQCI